jgi:hypothetical protein
MLADLKANAKGIIVWLVVSYKKRMHFGNSSRFLLVFIQWQTLFVHIFVFLSSCCFLIGFTGCQRGWFLFQDGGNAAPDGTRAGRDAAAEVRPGGRPARPHTGAGGAAGPPHVRLPGHQRLPLTPAGALPVRYALP